MGPSVYLILSLFLPQARATELVPPVPMAPASVAKVATQPQDVVQQPDYDQDWWSHAAAGIAAQEYGYSSLGEGVWSAPNRSQGLRSRISAAGLEVFPRSTGASGEGAPWTLRLSTRALGREGALDELGLPQLSVEGARVSLDRGGLVEWYVNDERGIEQGWTIPADPRPGRSGPLCIGLAVEGGLALRLAEDGLAGRFVGVGGRMRLRYHGLAAWDAEGRALEARLAPSPEGLVVRVDDAGAKYPLTVDPVISGPPWTAEGEQSGAQFGWSVSTAGDVNGDGYSDVIIGAPRFDAGQGDEGRAFLYLGSAAGPGASAHWTAESNQAGAQFGFCVAAAGDVDGDGYDDVLVSAPDYDDDQTDEGRAYLYMGTPSGLSASPDWTAESDQSDSDYGWSVSTAGDVNGDGYWDVLVGARSYTSGVSLEGRAYLYLGSSGGLWKTPAWTVYGKQVLASLGNSVSTAGDVNGDGYDDVLLGAPLYSNGHSGEGRAFLYQGSPSGLAASPAWTAESNQASAQFGFSVATAGDVDGDGFADVLVGANKFDDLYADEGRAYLFLGSSTGLASAAVWTVEGGQDGASLGGSVATAGDVDGSGYADVLVGAFSHDEPVFQNAGKFILYLGGASFPAETGFAETGGQAGAYLGYSVATAGDVNGDGFSDLIIGAPGFDGGQADEGRAYVHFGSGSENEPLDEYWFVSGGQLASELGHSVAAAGDVNGDGYGDVLASAWLFDSGQPDAGRVYLYLGTAGGLASSPAWFSTSGQAQAHFGSSVASAGDVNGDGLADVVIGASGFDNGQVDEGRVYLYLGSASSGLGSTAHWFVEGEQASAEFGHSVASAGDVNGDGFGDVIIGAWLYDDGQVDEGRAFVYLGSASGLATSPVWTAESDQAQAWFGVSVASAGDVDGDGFSDVIVGASRYDNGQQDEGRAYVWLGSVSGLAATPVWSAEIDVPGAEFGHSVSAAGDYNGDGFGDVCVGAPLYSDQLAERGAVFLFKGSPSGPITTLSDVYKGDHEFDWVGYSVGAAGDINADGYGDLVFGSPGWDHPSIGQESGAVTVVAGSATGWLAHAWGLIHPWPDAFWGTSVGGAGDVDGDGFDDVIAGAPGTATNPTSWGAVWVFPGNERFGAARRPQQRLVSDASPISLLGNSDMEDSFRIRVLAAQPKGSNGSSGAGTPAGRARVRMEWEVEPLGTPFSGTGLQKSSVWLDTGSPASSPLVLSERPIGLASGMSWHWRARIASTHPFFPHSPWLSASANTWSEPMLKTPGCPSPTVYCTAKVNSQGCTPTISWTGGPSASHASQFRIRASNVINKSFGILIYSRDGADSKPFQGGWLCVASTVRRTPVSSSGGNTGGPDCSGLFSFEFNDFIASGKDPGLVLGQQVWSQYWYRDVQSPSGTGLTDALHFTICQ